MIAQGFSAGLAYSDDPDSAHCEWCIGDTRVELEPMLGTWLQIQRSGQTECSHCGAMGSRSFGQGYCYDCFTSLARCDLCMMDPLRCHFDKGTCREPEWAERVCFSSHTVYLAVSSGLKVGITRWGNEVQRWRNQGASHGIRLLRCDTRLLAGEFEAKLAQSMDDRTRWRDLVSRQPPRLDLQQERQRALERLGSLRAGVNACADADIRIAYLDQRLAPPVRIGLADQTPFQGELIGVRGHYLLFRNGALNVRRVQGDDIQLSRCAPTNDQLELFS